jgi:hypothetical protein
LLSDERPNLRTDVCQFFEGDSTLPHGFSPAPVKALDLVGKDDILRRSGDQNLKRIIADLADYEQSSAPRRDLEQLSSDAGAKLLKALGVKGDQAELRSASDEFSGHCLALTLSGSYLTDAYNGDIRCRKEVSEHLSHDVRQGVHARKVMESYQAWLGEGPELSVLRMLGLFDRPADEKALEVLLKRPAIPGLTESLTDLSPSEWQMILARLRRARFLTGEDPHNPGHLDGWTTEYETIGRPVRFWACRVGSYANLPLHSSVEKTPTKDCIRD